MDNRSSPLYSLIAGFAGGVSAVLVGHPLDTIKVNLQYQIDSNQSRGFIGVIRQIYATDGIRGFARGISAPLLGVSPIIALSFSGYAFGKRIFEKPNTQLA
ncbi:Congested-like trachea protein [Thelohanellus kitauei]|uniref:Congested-like trachea protein n=1 Tax=Thelohanellus kitauei TaxID=669202 RepID=A0A0C2NJ64_THEKT|nr:Congested-like trachea protein [Thelohanellus kitauei]